MYRKYLIFVSFLCICFVAKTQPATDADVMPYVQSIQLTQAGKPLSYPVVTLEQANGLRLDFDDLDAAVKSYYYTFVHCNADWQPSVLLPAGYIKGFTQKRFSNYIPASIAKQPYKHYTLLLPEAESMPLHSGNYLLKVFLNGDTSKLVFTRRFLVVEPVVAINAAIQQPFDAAKSFTHQKVLFTVSAPQLVINNPQQQLAVNVLQNDRWDNAAIKLLPNFIRPTGYEYNDENTLVFEAGNEYRWLDITNMRVRTDKIEAIHQQEKLFDIQLLPEPARVLQPYIRYDDYNGAWVARTTDAMKTNPNVHGDYARVHFTLRLADGAAFTDKDVYWAGKRNNYVYNENARLKLNAATNYYELSLLLKEGYYTYCFVTKDRNNGKVSLQYTEGNDWQTENKYTILVYYRAPGDFADRLVGMQEINSIQLANR